VSVRYLASHEFPVDDEFAARRTAAWNDGRGRAAGAVIVRRRTTGRFTSGM
jgi:hypothetical protein